MSNLKNMTDKILENGKLEATKVRKRSEESNKKIIDSRILEASKKRDKIINEAKAEATMVKSRLKSEVQLEVRDEILTAKRQVLDKTFELAKENLKNIDEEKYLAFLKMNIASLDLKGSEVIIVPEKFKDIVKESGLNINVSQDESIESGFLIRDDNIIINYSFDSLVDFIKEDLEAEVAKILFEEKE